MFCGTCGGVYTQIVVLRDANSNYAFITEQKISIYCLSSLKLDVDKMYWSTVLVKNWKQTKTTQQVFIRLHFV